MNHPARPSSTSFSSIDPLISASADAFGSVGASAAAGGVVCAGDDGVAAAVPDPVGALAPEVFLAVADVSAGLLIFNSAVGTTGAPVDATDGATGVLGVPAAGCCCG